MRTLLSRLLMTTTVIAVISVLAGCGGGSGGGVTPQAAQSGNGRAAMELHFERHSTGRVAGTPPDANAISVSVTITGFYGEYDSPFTPVSATTQISASGGQGSVSLLEVPAGVNHLVTAVATWPDNTTDTIKYIIPRILKGEITRGVADYRTTIIADAVIALAQKEGIKLSKMPQSRITSIEAAVDAFLGAGYAPDAINIDDVLGYETNGSVATSIDVSPATATVETGGASQFTAIIKNTYDIEISGTVIWSVAGGVGTVDSSGLFTASTAGTGAVTATSGSLSGSAGVTVTGSVTSPVCGNSALETGEECDDGNTIAGDGCSDTCANDAKETNAWITISAGDFVMGCADADGICASDESPKHTVTLSEYKIQKYEVTNAQYQACVDAGACAAPGSTDSYTRAQYFGNTVYDNYPVINVSWNQADAYCAWIGARLLTEAEWEKAARGPSPAELIYPWGDDALTCELAAFYDGMDWCNGLQDTSEVGSLPGGASPYGVMDMIGSVWEFVYDWYDATYYTTGGTTWIDPQGPEIGSSRGLKGGSFYHQATYSRISERNLNATNTQYPFNGIRCGQDADVTGPVCGNGAVEQGENCDDGANNDQPGYCDSTCSGPSTASVCGNSLVETGETCDDGNTVTEACAYGQTSCAVCDSTCASVAGTTSYCGDGTTNTGHGETCDDGNTVTEACAYGQTSCAVCDSTCASMAGSTSYCGDGTTDTGNGETCDDSNAVTETCAYGQTSCTVCDSTCASMAGSTSYCGDGTTDTGNGETCDDGSFNGQPEYCDASCGGTTAAVCGNSLVEIGETCDDGNAVTETCAFGQTSCTVCDSTCASVAGATSYCGDGTTDTGNGETCDDGNTVTETCAFGQTSCTVCDSTCASVAGATSYCGDGTTDTGNGETCDDGNTVTEACAFGQTSCTVCDSTCASVVGATSYCGDGTTDTGNGETCDDGNAVTETCAFGQTSCTVCDSTCASVAGATSYCGDGTTDTGNGETCDDSNTVTETCAYGQTSCTVCDSICASVAGATSYCGDGTTDTGNGETCDEGVSNGLLRHCNSSCNGNNDPEPQGTFTTSSFNGCVLTSGGGVMCSGDNTYGQIGDGSTNSSLTPVYSSGITSGATFVSTSQHRTTCAIVNGGAKCWGYNGIGQVGNGTTTVQLTPVDVTGLTSGVVSLITGADNTCALTDTGGIKCWGNNSYGELGCTGCGNQTVPVDVTGLTSGVTKISGDAWSVCALLDTGNVKCWGWASACQLGNSNTNNKNAPVDVIGLPAGGIIDIAVAYNYACALTDTGGVKCWGGNSNGQLGNGTPSTMECTPVDVSGLTSGVAAIYAGQTTTCALLETGSLKCWGDNSFGQLGDGTITARSTPVDVTGLSSDVRGVVSGGSSGSGGGTQTCAVTSSQLKCWGRNNLGQFGDGATTQRLTPFDVNTWPWP